MQTVAVPDMPGFKDFRFQILFSQDLQPALVKTSHFSEPHFYRDAWLNPQSTQIIFVRECWL